MNQGKTIRGTLDFKALTLCFCLFVVMFASFAGAGTRSYRVRVCAPQPEEVLRGPDVLVWIEADGLDIRPGCNSIHIMLDNEPFAVKYDLSKPHRLHDVAPGTHTLRVYAANPYHEIIPATLCIVPFAVEYHDHENRPAQGEPLLTYVLPQGEYRGIDCADILLNFAVSGAPLSRRGYRVYYYVDGKRFISYRQESAHLRDLAAGYHRIRMELVDEKGRVVPGPFNVVERTILLSPEKELESPQRGASAKLFSIQGPMTSGRLWVKRSVGARTEEVPPKRVTEESSPTVKEGEPVKRAEEESTTPKDQPARSARSPEIADELVSPQANETTVTISGEQEGREAISTSSTPEPPRYPMKPESETTPVARARRVSLDQLAKAAQSQTTPTRTTLKAVTVGTTYTEYVRKVETPPLSSADSAVTRAVPRSTRVVSQDKAGETTARSSTELERERPTTAEEPLRPPTTVSPTEIRSLQETTQAKVLRNEFLEGAQEKNGDSETKQDYDDQTTAAISRVIGATGAVVVVETEKR
ncbi:MAG: hypothetical protein N2Z21_01440 [Candidatus Sumerlaeaceae bacterium]|nr:hypothetical protein [Candidatus Sumerlaeaceae bacterium]